MIQIYMEFTPKRTFASALDWYGWSRSGRDEAGALQSLLDYGGRYARILAAAGIDFALPSSLADFAVVERKPGNATTEFGAPDVPAGADDRPLDPAGLQHMLLLLRAYWQAFDAAVEEAQGKELRKGPRGGGRELDKIVEHVVGAEGGYLSLLAWKWAKPRGLTSFEMRGPTREAVVEALTAAAQGNAPKQRARGGAVWPPRMFARRAGWHIIDHVWEIEDRSI